MFGTYSVAMVTPFTTDGRIDLSSAERLADYLIGRGVPALLISGSTGEQHSLTIPERKELYRAVAGAVSGRARIFAGVAATTTAAAVELAGGAAQSGADGIMLGLPPYLRPVGQELIDYVTEVASATALPIMLYNNPPRTGTDIGVDEVVNLSKAGRIAAVKHSSGYEKGQEMIRRTEGRLKLYTGGDPTYLDAVAHGYTGVTSIVGNVLPEAMGQVVRLAAEGHSERTRAIHEPVAAACAALFATATPVGIKYALRKMGLPGGYCRKPLGYISPEQERAIDQALAYFHQ